MTRDSGTEAAALPKLLLDLIEQVEGNSKEKRNTDSESDERKEDDDLQQENIAHNLPKVVFYISEFKFSYFYCY